ncbi:DNA internalization-related competence protein ComEC/Rec2 [Aquimonas voraii]|uniref:Competence protein ComEC n=1 Tax=Aquimonas voraii TaxID=265719 RepID=A0A1G6SBF3_9GAMM|nr:DNA internalization-related competence protein ComEC/Rec2 [Aquimonas voraii]SDD14001.1 competence protein ComEC [Aquimonas voraii]
MATVPVLAGSASYRAALTAPAFGIGSALGLLVGVSAALTLTSLPPEWMSWLALVLGLLAWLSPRLGSSLLRWSGAALFGAALALLVAQSALQQRLPAELEGRDLRVQGRVEGLPQRGLDAVRFDFRVESGEGEADVLAGRLLRIGWYRSEQAPEAGSRWSLQLRLKAPRGVDNPGGFDFERHALQRRLAATGYVREHPGNRELTTGAGLDAVRARLSQDMVVALGGEGPLHAGSRFLRALTVADTRAFDEADWEVLRATGVGHLMSISGLHVGLVAGLFALFARGLYRLWPRLGLRLPLPQGAALAALLGAAGYAALAGFGVPVLRSLLMVAAALLAVLLRRRSSTWQAYALALLVLVLSDPLSVLGASFWLSFMGVAWLLWCMPSELQQLPGWRRLLGAQLVASLGLLPLTVFFFGQASVAGAAANLLAVPWVSLGVVPLALLGAGLLLLGLPMLATPVLLLAAWLMDLLWWLLAWTAGLPHAQVFLPEPGGLSLLLAAVGVIWLLMPRGTPGRALGAVLMVPLLWPRLAPPPPGVAELHLFDVGQGLSALIRTQNHALLLDTGPAFGSGLDMGEAAVVPALRALGLRRLDRVLVSHGDADHSGGTASVMRAFPAALQTSDRARFPQAQPCVAGERWRWDGVDFELLHPPEHFPYLRNESSCVLRVQAGGQVALFAGDIGRLIEQRLVREQPERLRADIVVVPHHGSAGSSDAAFVRATGARHALVAAGYANRFGHPRPEVVERWREAGARVWNTAEAGALWLRLGAGQEIAPQPRRRLQPRLWQPPPAAAPSP